ncbi:MAG TPA: tripartite tricarboxylate transporter TctB family protein [Methylomirabilota bacterium]|nr:tripartite tricarboxylate transporter TctB family protein [Methylomirabilota bacterium]
MRRADRAGAVLLLLFGVWFAAVALRNYTYWGATGPGAGFFPFWLGLAMAVLAALLLVRAAREREPGPGWVPRGRGAVRFLGVLGASVAFVTLLPWVGMALGTVLFLVVILKVLEGHSWTAAVGVAIGTAVVNWAVFTWWLRVPFPAGVLGF